ncbi:MAG: hypothetical protein HYZ34_12610 [Ignavibacteriae bacterium]|nr:hypothetical protein [Ignavibacteriota bacterium]
MVTEYFRPLSAASRFEFLCDDDKSEQARAIIHRIGTCGSVADHFVEITEFVPRPFDIETIGKHISPLEQ